MACYLLRRLKNGRLASEKSSCTSAPGGIASGITLGSVIVASLFVVLLSTYSSANGANRSFKYKKPDGTVLFTDVRMNKGEVARGHSTRSSYQGNYGRITATASCRGMNGSSLRARSDQIQPLFQRYAKHYSVDPDLIKAIARIESCFDKTAVSSAGAKGIMQLMPATASYLGVNRIFDPEQNIRGGVRYFAEMKKRFNGNLKLALAAYNAGPGAVNKYNGIPPYPETQKYVVRVLAKYREYSKSKSASLQ